MTDIGHPERLSRYLWRRVTRIYPIYWFVTGIEVVHASFSPDSVSRLASSHLLHSFLLLPDDSWPLVSVAWTLQSEMLFYLVFVLVIVDRSFAKPLIAGALVLVIIGAVAVPTGSWTVLLFSPFNIEFLMGVAAAVLLARRRLLHPTALIGAGTILFFMIGATEVLDVFPLDGLTGRMLYGSASAIVLLGLVELERGGCIRIGTAGVMLGDLSYCLYLIHLPVIPITVRICAHFGLLTRLPVSILVIALVAEALFAAFALHRVVELPLISVIRSFTPRICR